MITQLARYWWALALRGLCGILFGLAAFFWPGITLTVLMAFFGGYALVDGIFAIVAAVAAARQHERWSSLLLEGIVGIALALVTFFWPGITAVALVYVVAFWAIVTGILEIAAAIRLRKEIAGEWMLGLSGVLSLILGALLFFMPYAGAIGLIWVMGSYAMVFGVLLLMLAFRLRTFGQHLRTPIAT